MLARTISAPPHKTAREITHPTANAQPYGPLVRLESGLMGDVKFFDGLGELRIDYGPGYRVYFVQRGQTIIILLCGGDKSSQSRDIARARLAAQEY